MKDVVVRAFAFISNPEKGFEFWRDKKFDDILSDYIKLLLLSGMLAGIANFCWQISSSAYLMIFHDINIDMWRLLNYASQNATGIFFFYLFAGTLLFSIISLLFKLFLNDLKYVKVLGLMMLSSYPFLLLGWPFPELGMAFSIWGLTILVIGVKSWRSTRISRSRGNRSAK